MSCVLGICGKFADVVAPMNPVTEKREIHLIPESGEIALGATMYSQMVRSERTNVITQGEMAGKIKVIVSKLQAHAKRSYLPYEVTLIANKTVNAWCLPGGKMVVYGGLAEKIQTAMQKKKQITEYVDPKTKKVVSYENVTEDDVLAALLAHEMTHADARHAARKLEWTAFVQLCIFGASAFCQNYIDGERAKISSSSDHRMSQKDQSKSERLDSLEEIHNIVFNRLIKWGTSLYHLFGSRQYEYEADKYGTRLAVKAGYNWKGALLLQQILQEDSCPSGSNWVIDLFRTHASCESRQEAIFAAKEAEPFLYE